MQDPDYWLYSFHLALRSYVEEGMGEKEQSYRNLEIEHGEEFSRYYYNLLVDTYHSIGKEKHRSSLARFSLIFQGGYNDFDRAIGLSSR